MYSGAVCWITGLPGAGKTTLALNLENRLDTLGYKPFILDGDDLRQGLSSDLGFDKASRSENVRRAAELARLLASKGFFCIVSMVSPYSSDRQNAKTLIAPMQFYEVYLCTPLEVCMRRDPKGLYGKALRNEIHCFTGLSDVYQAPDQPDCSIDTSIVSIIESVDLLLGLVVANGLHPVSRNSRLVS